MAGCCFFSTAQKFYLRAYLDPLIYIHLYDIRMTMLTAPPSRPWGIKFRNERHSAGKDRNISRACQGKKPYFVKVNVFGHRRKILKIQQRLIPTLMLFKAEKVRNRSRDI